MTSRLTLFELNTMVSSTIQSALPDEYWVESELMEIRESRGHCYMEMVQKDVFSSALVARASAKCWQSKWKNVSKKFVQATGGLPVVGMKLLLKVSIDFHPSYGFALIVSDIDPSYTLGEMAQRRQEIIDKLKEEGVYDLQRELVLPLFAQRIAVISSATAAGYGDFCSQLANNEYGFGFTTTLFPAVMQGEMVSQSIISQLNEICHRQDEFDCVVIIRGGGATSDMSSFDSLELAENVANFPIPIITGIGHERDECVLDLIAHHKVKTPTAVAAFLIEHLLAVWSRVEQAQEAIIDCISIILERRETHLRELSMSIRVGSLLYCTRRESELRLLNVRIDTAVQTALQDEDYRLSLLAQRIEGLDPKLMLHRGYTMTLCGGHIVKRSVSLQQGQEIETMFEDGKVKSIIK